MSNKRRGTETENKYRLKLLEEGWDIVQRSAGSKSKVDIWALKKDEVLIVQMKRSKTKHFSYKQELKEFRNLKVPVSVFKRFIVWVDRVGWITIYED